MLSKCNNETLRSHVMWWALRNNDVILEES